MKKSIQEIKEYSIPEFLKKQKTGEYIKPPVQSNSQELPFNDLTWELFEILCLKLALKEPNSGYTQLYGIKGQKQAGIDIYSRNTNDDKYKTYQSKRVEKFTANDIKTAVKKFLNDEWSDKSSHFILCMKISTKPLKIANEIEKQAKACKNKGVIFLPWGKEELERKLKDNVDIIYDLFGINWANVFCGVEKVQNYLNEIKQNESNFLDQCKNISETNLNKIQPLTNVIINDCQYHIMRPEVDEIINKLNDNKIIFVSGIAGSGKSVVLFDLANKLFNSNQKVLFIQGKDCLDIESEDDFIRILRFDLSYSEWLTNLKQLESELIIFIDSMDVITWHSSILPKFVRIVNDINSTSKTKVIISCREFDLLINKDLQPFLVNNNEIKIQNIKNDEIKKIFNLANIKLPIDNIKENEIINFFSIPLRLDIVLKLLKISTINIEKYTDEISLFDELWNFFINCHDTELINEFNKKRLIFAIIDEMINSEKLSIAKGIIEKKQEFSPDVYEVLLSHNFLNEHDFKIEFFHQTVFDYAYIRKLLENGQSIESFIEERKYDLFIQPIIRLYLKYCNKNYIHDYILSMKNIIIEKKYNFIWKIIVIQHLADLISPNHEEINLIIDLLNENDLFINNFFILANENWSIFLNDSGYIDKVIQDEDEAKTRNIIFLLQKFKIKSNEEKIVSIVNKFININFNELRYDLLLVIQKFSDLNIIKFLEFISCLVNSEEGKHYHFDTKDFKKIINSLHSNFPEETLNIIIKLSKTRQREIIEYTDVIKNIILIKPELINKLIIEFDKEEKRFNNVENNKSTILFDEFYIFHEESNSFYANHDYRYFVLLTKLIEDIEYFILGKDIDKYKILFNILKNSKYQTLARINIESSITGKLINYYYEYYYNIEAWKNTLLRFILLKNLKEIWATFSPIQQNNVVSIIIDFFKWLSDFDEKEKFHIWRNILEIKLLLPEISNSEINDFYEKAKTDCLKYIQDNKENLPNIKKIEDFDFTPHPPASIQGIRQIGSVFTDEEFNNSSEEEKEDLLINYGPDKDRNLEYWWVENARKTCDAIVKDPIGNIKIIEKIINDDDMYPYREYAMRSLTEIIKLETGQKKKEEIEKINILSKFTINQIIDFALRIIRKRDIPDKFKSNNEISSPIRTFLDFVCNGYEFIAEQLNNDDKSEILNLVYKFSYDLKDIPDHGEPLQSGINSIIGNAIEAMCVILHYEDKQKKFINRLIKLSKNKSLAITAVLGNYLIYLKRYYSKYSDKILKIWTRKKNVVPLKFIAQNYFYSTKYRKDAMHFIKRWITFLKYEDIKENYDFRYSISGRGAMSAAVFISWDYKEYESIVNKIILNGNDNLKLALEFQFYQQLSIEEYYNISLSYLYKLAKCDNPLINYEIISDISNEKSYIHDNDFIKLLEISSKNLKNNDHNASYLVHEISKKLLKVQIEDKVKKIRICNDLLNYNISFYYLDDLSKIATDCYFYLENDMEKIECINLFDKLLNKGWRNGIQILQDISRR